MIVNNMKFGELKQLKKTMLDPVSDKFFHLDGMGNGNITTGYY